jgi:hypothetical protein
MAWDTERATRSDKMYNKRVQSAGGGPSAPMTRNVSLRRNEMKWTICLMVCTLFLTGCAQTKDDSVSQKTELFRSDWKDGQRAEVTKELVAMLKVGMSKKEVASILERPSRPNDGIAKEGGSEKWTFSITLGRVLVLTFDDDKLTNIDGG